MSLSTFLIVCPLLFLAGFVDAIAGGGGLISLPACMLAGLPVHYAIGTNKLSSAMGTAVATWKYSKAGFINWKASIPCIIAALAGAATGSNLCLLLDEKIFKTAMLFVLPLIAFYVMKTKSFEISRPALSDGVTVLLMVITAFTVGLYDGFYGPGAGTFLILLLTGIARLPLTSANGVAKAINMTTDITSVTVFLINGKVCIILGITAGLFCIAGSILGVKCFKMRKIKLVKLIILAVLLIFTVKLIYECFIS